jgi:uncharacterized protein YprB with RNaseH-like and TPR domain
MKLEDKLRNLERFNPAGQKGTTSVKGKDQPLDMLDGKITQNRYGEFVVVKKGFDPEVLQQEVKLPRSWKISGEMLARVCSSKRRGQPEVQALPFNPAQAAFFDCETTGLAGGVGTYAFLVGVGYLSEEEFVVEQYFMQDFHQERAVLSAVAERLARFKFLVSYNGKCFDLPLLETRWSIHRIDYDSGQWTHVDLLYPCRRLWKKRIGDCSLGNVEDEILGVRRKVDVPSYMVPQIYFDYLRSGELEPLVPVFHHNLYDILSLLRLAILIDNTLEDFTFEKSQDPIDLYSLGRIHRNLGNDEASLRCLEQALSERPSPELQLDIKLHLSYLQKRIGCLEAAADIWHGLIEGDFPFCVSAHEELAKYYEHRMKDYHKALSVVDGAISYLSCDLSSSVSPAWQRKLNSLEYRKSRLKRKIQRSSERAEREDRSSG